jgi:clan AA aspartic protease
MGLTYVNARLEGPNARVQRLRFLVDSGTGYCVLPPGAWKKLGLKPKRVEYFNLADGTPVRRQVSECLIRLGEREGHTPVILGETGDCALMGVITLEVLGLVLDPFRRKLLKMRHRL